MGGGQKMTLNVRKQEPGRGNRCATAASTPTISHAPWRDQDARALTLALGGRWHGHYGAAPCPVCQCEARRDQNALTLADGRNGRSVLHCKKSACTYADLLAALGLQPGSYTPPDPANIAKREAERRVEAENRTRRAQRLWKEAQPIKGTPSEAYLRGRGITCALPDTLRFHPGAWHLTAQRVPALVARIDGAEGFAVHRTFLHPDGSGKADVEPAKAMLGPVTGGAVRLADGPDPLVVAEGLETALSLSCGLLRAPAATWAALSASGIRALRLPARPGRLTIATDGDVAGREAGQTLAERAHALGWAVTLLPAPDGRDWNDILRMKGGAA